MKKNKINRILFVMSIFILTILYFINNAYAEFIGEVGLYKNNDCGSLLKYNGVPVIVSYIEYQNQDGIYPAYCLDKNKVGAETIEYNVSVTNYINDDKLWRIITNGYPYKTIDELGVANKEEAFTATKQAIYCYIHGNDVNLYEGIGNEGIRTLEALKRILYNAEISNETKISCDLKISPVCDEWKLDEIDNNYISKTYKVLNGENISKFNIKLEGENNIDKKEIKITNLKNIEKNEFLANEEFKVLVSISKQSKENSFKFKGTAKVLTKPVLYGKAPDNNYQDYAITVSPYEDGEVFFEDTFPKNNTKIIINKKDKETKNAIKGVEFEILDSNKNVKYSGLKTDENGQIIIDNVVPGIYYLKETVAESKYSIYDDLIEMNVHYQEEYSLDVYNERIEKKEINTSKLSENKTIKKLPVTGM